jgi:hypothetical protein
MAGPMDVHISLDALNLPESKINVSNGTGGRLYGARREWG